MVIVEGIILHKDGVIINLNVFGKSEILWFNDMEMIPQCHIFDAEVHPKIVTHVIPVVVVVINRARSLFTTLGNASLFACFSDFCDPPLGQHFVIERS
jgi:hypothetical protein